MCQTTTLCQCCGGRTHAALDFCVLCGSNLSASVYTVFPSCVQPRADEVKAAQPPSLGCEGGHIAGMSITRSWHDAPPMIDRDIADRIRQANRELVQGYGKFVTVTLDKYGLNLSRG